MYPSPYISYKNCFAAEKNSCISIKKKKKCIEIFKNSELAYGYFMLLDIKQILLLPIKIKSVQSNNLYVYHKVKSAIKV